MGFIEFSYFPIAASTDCSLMTEAFYYPTTFDEAFTADPFTRLDTSLTDFDAYFGQPITSADATNSVDSTSSVAPTTGTQPKSASNSPFVQSPLRQLDVFSYGFPFDANPISSTSDFNISPLSDDSPTPSLGGDVPQNALALASTPLSPRSQLRRQSTNSIFKSDNCSESSNPPKRKRGRPRLDRSSSSLCSLSTKTHRSQRLPHTQVERKYREGLNACLERLRKTVPTLCQADNQRALPDHPKLSKAAILEGAVEYIKEIKKERDLCLSAREGVLRGARFGVPVTQLQTSQSYYHAS
ncbi:hypothetical protein DPSP01_014563 [Paraphaeosphaeria sporulosa]